MKNRTIVTMLLAVSALLALADAASAYYSPRLGRFLNRDPLNEQGAMLTRTGRQPTTFLARDQLVPAEQNLYAFVGNRPVDHVDVLGLWTKNGVLMYLCRTDQGRQVADNLDRRAKVLKSEFVRSYFHTRASVADPWGPWQNVDWGGMTINRHDIHVPKDFGDDETALILTHEVVHVTSPKTSEQPWLFRLMGGRARRREDSPPRSFFGSRPVFRLVHYSSAPRFPWAGRPQLIGASVPRRQGPGVNTAAAAATHRPL